MGLFDKIKEPIFLKEDSNLPQQLSFLEDMLKTAPVGVSKRLEQEIRNLKAGIIGEQQVAFELKNSHIPMYVLHDLYLEYEGLTAQIDYMVITRRRHFVIECKNLYGNIEITSQGDFIRNVGYPGKFFKERIYSPITQNERHMSLIKKIRSAERTNILTQTLFEKYFTVNYRSVVLLANPKTVLNDKYAKKEVKDQVIPVDRLISHIKEVNAEKGAEDCFEKDMTELANFFLTINKPSPEYAQKYYSICEDASAENQPTSTPTKAKVEDKKVAEPEGDISGDADTIKCSRCGAEMVLRTATKGDNAGNTFYGCSRFPKCRNIVAKK